MDIATLLDRRDKTNARSIEELGSGNALHDDHGRLYREYRGDDLASLVLRPQ